ncbi:MAG TPA: PepSY-associated TM helix domain-containing protein [Burkholderiales bacterium]|nr:PepSY-associated TM helix domain-containing protein [Burkholderiales bacterium]
MSSRVLVALHKYVSLSVGVLIALIGLSGASLVFRHSIENAIHPERGVLVPEGGVVSWEAMFRSALSAVPDGRVFTINAAQGGDRAYEVYVEHPREPRRLYVDPYNGRIVTDSREPGTPVAILFRFHTSLLSGESGGYVVAAIGTALLVLSISGFILWWPRRLRGAFRVRWGGNPLALSFDLHRVGGVLFAFLLAMNATTGIIMVFSTASGKVIEAIAGRAPPLPALPEESRRVGTYRSLDELVRVADLSFSSGYITRLRVPRSEGLVTVQRRVPEDERHPNGLNRVFVDPYTATVVGTLTAANNPTKTRIWAWLYPLHIGEYFGNWQRVLWLFVGLAPAFMLVTGLTVWWKRLQARGNRPASAAAASKMQRAPEH